MRVALLRVAVFFVCIIMGVNAPAMYAQLGTFKSTGPMVVTRTGPTVTLLHNGTVLVTGGSDGANALSSAEIFDSVSGTFRLTKGSMSTPRYGNTATLLSDGRVLIEGGYDHIPTASDPALDSAEIYDPDMDSFLPAGRMQTRHTLNRAKEVLLNNGQVLLAGGEANWTASGCFPVLSTAQLFDPNTNQFSFTTGNLTTSRQESEETLLLTGRVLLSGGFDTNCNILGSAELYDPVSQKFTSTGNLNFSRLGQASTLLPDGRVLVTGGLPGVSLISAENYANGIFTSSNGTLTHSRFNHTSTLLDDGTVLLVGGTGDGGSSRTAEIYDPATDSFRPTVGSMASSYSGHRAVKLRNGNVLLIGGGNPEIYIFTNAQESNSIWPMTGHDPQRTGLSPFTGPKSAPTKPSWTYPTGAAVIGDLVISAEGIIYFASDKLYALKPDGTPLVPAVTISALTSPVVDDSNGLIYVIANNSVRGYDVLRYSKQLQNPAVIYHGDFVFVVPTSMTLGPDGTIYFSDGVSIIAAGTRNWRSVDRPCFGNPGFLAPILGRDGSIYSMCQSGGGAGFGSGVYRFDGNTGAQLASSGYNRGGTELIIDGQNRIRAGYQAFNGIIFTGSYDNWDINLNQLTPTSLFDFTTSRSALMPDGFSTVRIGFSFQSNELDATGAHIWGVPSGSQTLPNFSTVPTVDAAENIFVGTVAGLAALSGLDGHIIWFSPVSDVITTQPVISSDGTAIVGSAGGNIYAFSSKSAITTGTILVTTMSGTANIPASFDIKGPVAFSGIGPSFTKANVPTGTYTITYNPVSGFVTPQPQSLILHAGDTITFEGLYLLPPPSITKISPDKLTRGQINPQFTIEGLNFQPCSTNNCGSQISFGGTGLTVVSYSTHTDTEIIATVSVARDAPPSVQSVTVTNPDGQQATQTVGVVVRKRPVIVIPGILGSELDRSDNKHEVWLDVASVLLSNSNENPDNGCDSFLLPLALDQDGKRPASQITVNCGLPLGNVTDKGAEMFASHIFTEVAGSKVFYGPLLDSLADFPATPFPYDWRLDFRAIAPKLRDLITSLAPNPWDRVDIVAHSQGGLIARTYISMIKQVQLDPTISTSDTRIDTIIYLGTPHKGAAKSYSILHHWQPIEKYYGNLFSFGSGIKKFNLNTDTMLAIGENYPATYNLLPRYNFFSANGQFEPFGDTYKNPDTTLPNSVLLSKANDLWDGVLNQPPSFIRSFSVNGSGQNTLRALINIPGTDCIVPGNDPTGDSTVPSISASALSGATNLFLKVDHASLPSDPGVETVVRELLDDEDVPNVISATVKTSPFSAGSNFVAYTCSPVVMSIQDAQGNLDGIDTRGDNHTEIPNSDFFHFAKTEGVILAGDQQYNIDLTATAAGMFTLVINLNHSEENIGSIRFDNIPISSLTKAHLTLTFTNSTPIMAVDVNGDGTPEFSVSASQPPPPVSFISVLIDIISRLNAPIDLRNDFEHRLEEVSRQLDKQHTHPAIEQLNDIRRSIVSARAKNKITSADADLILSLIDHSLIIIGHPLGHN